VKINHMKDVSRAEIAAAIHLLGHIIGEMKENRIADEHYPFLFGVSRSILRRTRKMIGTIKSEWSRPSWSQSRDFDVLLGGVDSRPVLRRGKGKYHTMGEVRAVIQRHLLTLLKQSGDVAEIERLAEKIIWVSTARYEDYTWDCR
jgi:hypothetical protein